MQRRGFLGAILAAGVAPAYVGSSVLMPVKKVIAALTKILAATSTIIGAHGFQEGDLFTIAGVSGTFRVTSARSNGVFDLAAYKHPSLIDRMIARVA